MSKAIHKAFSDTPSTSGIYDFFNQGSLYVKTSEAFNPAIDLDFGGHRDAVLKILSLRSNDNAGLFVGASTRLSLFELLKRIPEFRDLLIDVTTKKTHAEGIKKFGIATCLGLWVPDGYKYKVERILYKSPNALKRREKLGMIYNLLLVSKQSEFSEIVDALKTILEWIAIKVGLPQDTFYLTLEKGVHPNISRMIRKTEYCLQRLSPEGNYRLRNLLINPYFITCMPTFWDDELVRDNFLISICNSLIAESERKRIENYVYQSLTMFGETEIIVSAMSSKPEQLLRPLFINYKDRWFSQYDLKSFKKLNEGNTDMSASSQ